MVDFYAGHSYMSIGEQLVARLIISWECTEHWSLHLLLIAHHAPSGNSPLAMYPTSLVHCRMSFKSIFLTQKFSLSNQVSLGYPIIILLEVRMGGGIFTLSRSQLRGVPHACLCRPHYGTKSLLMGDRTPTYPYPYTTAQVVHPTWTE